MGTASNATKPPTIFFDARGNGYWLELKDRYLPLDKASINLHLRRAGLSKEAFVGHLNQLEAALVKAQLERAVDYAGPLAGHRCGLFKTTDGAKILVTSEPDPGVFSTNGKHAGDFPFLDQFFSELLGNQAEYALAWLKTARDSLRGETYRPGQMLALAGPSNCGKSLLQAVVTEILGGRSAKPYRYMIGETAFNAELAGAEHLQIEDEAASTDIRARRKFGASVKDFTVNSLMSIHAKGRQAVNLVTFKRLTLSVNDEPEALMVLPPLDDSLKDKIMLFRCERAELPADRKRIWNSVLKELPAFLTWLDKWSIPARLRQGRESKRFGVDTYHNKDLFELLSHVSPETRLLNLVDEAIKWHEEDHRTWIGTAVQLEKKIRTCVFGSSVDKLFYYDTACSVYLSRLAQQHPERVSRGSSKRAEWTICGP